MILKKCPHCHKTPVLMEWVTNVRQIKGFKYCCYLNCCNTDIYPTKEESQSAWNAGKMLKYEEVYS